MTRIATIVAAVLAAAAVFFAVTYLYTWARRYFAVSAEERERAERERLEAEAKPGYFGLLVRTWARVLAPYVPAKLLEDLEKRIVMAGGLGGMTSAQVVLYSLLATMIGLAAGLFAVIVTGWPPTVVIAATLIGALLPFIWLRDQVKRRHSEILRDLPYHLDLLTLCVEAGLDFGAGVQRMVQKGKAGPLRTEFSTFMAELRVGKTRAQALEAMGERVGLEALSTFLSALIAADRLGTGLGVTLRIQAEMIRTERFQRAEKLAGEAPVKMLIPLVLFIFPTIWIILGAPLVFDWIFQAGP